MRLGVGDPRLQPDVRGDDRRAVLRRHPQVVGVAEPADVVADDRTDLARGVEHAGPPGVARDRDVEALVQRFDGPDDPIELLFLGHLGTGPGLHAADVEHVGALGDDRFGPPEEGVERERRAVVVERVGRAVEDAHHERAGAEVVHAITEPVAGGIAPHLTRATPCYLPFSSSTIGNSAPRSAKSTATSVGPGPERPRIAAPARRETTSSSPGSRWSDAEASASG